VTMSVTDRTATRLRAEFFIEESPRFLDFKALTIYITAALRVNPHIHRPLVTAIGFRRTVRIPAGYRLPRARPRITIMAPPKSASAPVPIAGSISGASTVALANETCEAINVTAKTARKL